MKAYSCHAVAMLDCWCPAVERGERRGEGEKEKKGVNMKVERVRVSCTVPQVMCKCKCKVVRLGLMHMMCKLNFGTCGPVGASTGPSQNWTKSYHDGTE